MAENERVSVGSRLTPSRRPRSGKAKELEERVAELERERECEMLRRDG